MLVFPSAKTPKKTIEAVLELLETEAARHAQSSRTAKLVRDKHCDLARSNAIRNIASLLRDCNLMHEKE